MKPIVILDLEWNGTYSKRLKGFINEIIEFGAVKTDSHLQPADTFSLFVRPQVGKKISGKIATLTSITDKELEHGWQFMQVVSRFRKWAGDCILMTWGTSDILTLIENCRYFSGTDRIPFLTDYVDLQAYCEKQMSYRKGKQIGLSTAAQLLQIDVAPFDHHRALDDSLLSLQCLRKLYAENTLQAFLQDATKSEFYDRMEFRTVTLCDIENPLLKNADWSFCCPVCGHPAEKDDDWVMRNKSFRAVFHCPACKKKFYGRMQFKLKYEGLSVRKSVHRFEEEPKKQEVQGKSSTSV